MAALAAGEVVADCTSKWKGPGSGLGHDHRFQRIAVHAAARSGHPGQCPSQCAARSHATHAAPFSAACGVRACRGGSPHHSAPRPGSSTGEACALRLPSAAAQLQALDGGCSYEVRLGSAHCAVCMSMPLPHIAVRTRVGLTGKELGMDALACKRHQHAERPALSICCAPSPVFERALPGAGLASRRPRRTECTATPSWRAGRRVRPGRATTCALAYPASSRAPAPRSARTSLTAG